MLLCFISLSNGLAFSPLITKHRCNTKVYQESRSENFIQKESNVHDRRNFIQTTSLVFTGVFSSQLLPPNKVLAEDEPSISKPSLPSLLYTILRVREATTQESRLIGSGKFKDVQRANVKLAVKFMVKNYKLSDTFIQASAYLNGNKRVQAGEIGQSAVQTLYTILEYFDSSDVQNIKVGELSEMVGKEKLVLKGLESTRSRIDEFLAFFPEEEVNKVKTIILEENALNEKEFDPSLGVIVNPNPKV